MGIELGLVWTLALVGFIALNLIVGINMKIPGISFAAGIIIAWLIYRWLNHQARRHRVMYRGVSSWPISLIVLSSGLITFFVLYGGWIYFKYN